MVYVYILFICLYKKKNRILALTTSKMNKDKNDILLPKKNRSLPMLPKLLVFLVLYFSVPSDHEIDIADRCALWPRFGR